MGYSYVDCVRADIQGNDQRGGGLIIYHRAALPKRKLNVPAIADPTSLTDLLIPDLVTIYELTVTDIVNTLLTVRTVKMRR